jgi:hypothetical protein
VKTLDGKARPATGGHRGEHVGRDVIVRHPVMFMSGRGVVVGLAAVGIVIVVMRIVHIVRVPIVVHMHRCRRAHRIVNTDVRRPCRTRHDQRKSQREEGEKAEHPDCVYAGCWINATYSGGQNRSGRYCDAQDSRALARKLLAAAP